MCDENQQVAQAVNPLYAFCEDNASSSDFDIFDAICSRFVEQINLFYGEPMDMDQTHDLSDVVLFYLDRANGNVEEIELPPSAWEIAERWYGEHQIRDDIARNGGVPQDVSSAEFAAWLTEQYRLAMAKGIQFGRDEAREAFDADR